MQNRFSRYATPDPIVKPADPLAPGKAVEQRQSITGGAIDNQLKGAKVPYADSDAALDNRGKRIGVQKSAQELRLDDFKAGVDLKQRYDGDVRVKTYRDIVPQVAAAMAAPDNAQGDLSIVYAFGKVMDPGSAVREGELDLAQGTSSLTGRLRSYIGMVESGKRLPPETRKQLVNTMRERGHQYNLAYSEARKQYLTLAKQGGFDPTAVIGPHDGGKYQQLEANFKGAPVFNLDGSKGAEPERWKTVTDQEIRQFVIDNQGMNPEAMAEYAKFKLGRTIDNLPEVLDHLKRTGHISNLVNRTEAGTAELNGLAQGLLHPLDRAAAGAETGFNWLTGANSTSARDVNAARDAYFNERPVNQSANTLGRAIGAGVLTAPLGGPMTQGALSGALMGDSEGLGVALDAGLGAVGGKLADGLLRGGAQLLSPRLEEPVTNLAREGAMLTPGRFFPSLKKAEDLARSYPMVGTRIDDAMERSAESVNRIPANRALGNIGQSLPEDVPAGHAAVGYTQRTLGDGYNKTLGNVEAGLDPTFITRMNYLGQRSGLRPAENATLDDIVQREVGGAFTNGQGKISGRDFKRLDSRLGHISSKLQASPDDPFKAQLGDSVEFVKDQLGALLRRQNPQAAKTLRDLDNAWSEFVPYQRAAAMAPEDGIATPGQFRAAVRQGDRSLRKGATARGEARLQDFASDASKVIPATRGNSGTTDRANLMSPSAWALGTALSPLYSKPGLDLINRMATRQAGPFTSLSAKTLRALPGGTLGGLLPLWIEP